MEWSVGDVRVTLVRESSTVLPLEVMFPEAERSVLAGHEDWLAPLMEDGALPMSVHTLVLESQGKVIVVDTCVGTRDIPEYGDLSNQPTTYLSDVADAGYKPEDVDVVLCTHLHLDHVGWNTHLDDGKWIPTFPNARYLFGRVDYEYWDSGGEGAAWTFDDAVRPVYEAGLADLVEMDHVVNSEVRFEPTPGHSPGHVSVHISSQGADAVITGDVVHHPVQFIAPHWRMFLDGDPEMAAKTRADFIARYAGSGVRIFGTHFPGDSTGFLERSGESVRFA